MLCAGFLTEFFDRTYIIDSENHSVCYDGTDTWDLSLGVVFRNYRYPNQNLPKPEMIPSFDHLFAVEMFDIHYSNEGLLSSSKSTNIKMIIKQTK